MLLNHPRLKTTREEIKNLHDSQQQALQQILGEAERIKTTSFKTVMDKQRLPPSGDKHDYLSFGPYWWPNPETSDGLPYIRRDGELNPETEQSDKTALAQLIREVERLALAYFYSEDESFAVAAVHRLRAWFIDDETRMNPHLEYGQSIPGICDGRGIGIIDTVELRLLPDVLTILESSTSWTREDDLAIRQWLADYLEWLLTSPHGLDEADEHNNHGTWYDVQVALFALATDQIEIARTILQEVPTKRFASQMASDGSQPHELARTRSFSYSCYNLSAFFDLATLAESIGIDLWHWQGENGSNLQKAIEFLAPYAGDDSPWTLPQIVVDDRSQLLVLLQRAKVAFPDGNWTFAIKKARQTSARSAELQLLWP